METRCPACSTVIPHTAHYCPKCGVAAPAAHDSVPPRAADAIPATGPIPRWGMMFLLLGLVGFGVIIVGLAGRNPPLIYAGAAIVGVLAVTAILGDVLT